MTTIVINEKKIGAWLVALMVFTGAFAGGVFTGRGCQPGPVPTPDVNPVDPVTPPVVPPVPTPEPVDPGPFVGLEGLRLLVVYETGAVMSPQLQAVLFGKATQEYLARKCPKGINGWPEFRMWDPDTDVSGHGVHWDKAMELPRQSLPWYVVGNGKSWERGPLIKTTEGDFGKRTAPLTPAEFLTILKKYGGE